jgi:RNA polymerase sigma-70 factor (ECF subfamily)
MDAAPNRDVEAETLLYGSLAPRARLYGLRHLRDTHAAADLAQEALMMTLQRLRDGKIREPARIASFVLGVCRQLVIDWKRGQRRREHLLERYSAEFDQEAVESAPVVSVERLRQCMEGLSHRERSVLLMSFFEERGADVIANELQLSTANVRVIRHRGMERLRKCMNGEDESA